MSGIAAVMVAVVTALTGGEGDHRMIHHRVCEGSTRVLVAAVAVHLS